MKSRLSFAAVWMVAAALLMAPSCSRERVESVAEMNAGIGLSMGGNHVDAEEHLMRATEIDPTHAQAFSTLGLVRMELQKWNAAREAFQAASALEPTRAIHHEKIGTVLTRVDPPNIEGAIAAFERAIELDPNRIRSHYRLGQLHEQQGEFREALQAYTNAATNGPRFIEAYAELGRLYANLGMETQATQVLQQGLSLAIEGTEEKARLHHLIGTLHMEREEWQQAVEELRKAVEIVPNSADSLFALGEAYAKLENREEARRFYERFVQSAGPDTPPSYVQVAQQKIQLLEGL